MKAIKKLLGGIGLLLITICFLIISYMSYGTAQHALTFYSSILGFVTLPIGICLTIAGIFTKVE